MARGVKGVEVVEVDSEWVALLFCGRAIGPARDSSGRRADGGGSSRDMVRGLDPGRVVAYNIAVIEPTQCIDLAEDLLVALAGSQTDLLHYS